MSFEDRIEAALAAIQQHNEAVGGPDKPGYVNPDQFIQCVKATGGTNANRLSALSHEDLLVCMPDGPNGVKPRVLMKEIAAIFRAADAPQQQDEKRPVSSKKAEKMTLRELVSAFDPQDSNNSVGVRLAAIAKKERFIVYSNARIVDVDTTFKILSEISAGYPGRDDIDVNGVIKKVYALGELPENYADENPLYRDRPLRPDGTCDQTGRSWAGVDLPVRQIVRLAMDSGELKVSHEMAHNTLDLVMEQDAFKKLRNRYRKAAIQYDELLQTGDLPSLKIPLGNGGSEGKNPFADGKQVVWAVSPEVPNTYTGYKTVAGHYVQMTDQVWTAATPAQFPRKPWGKK